MTIQVLSCVEQVHENASGRSFTHEKIKVDIRGGNLRSRGILKASPSLNPCPILAERSNL